MSHFRRANACVLALVAVSVAPAGARAQFSTAPIEFSGSITLDEADSGVRAHLERIRAYVADRHLPL
ncbi:MAG TPA: hypothetical protein VMR25_00490, partial [Planctomycetaceae bacterium]|nr:hypothetical protein [Planctomycetaceae bacterium]